MSWTKAKHPNRGQTVNASTAPSRITTMSSSEISSDGNKSSPSTTKYAVNLRISSVETGILCQSGRWHTHQFRGLGAFNFYFDYLLPNADGFSLPDVWDGYFHITLGGFDLRVDDEEQKTLLLNHLRNNINCEQHYPNIFPCRFRARQLEVHDGSKRDLERSETEFVTLKVEDYNQVWSRLHPLLRTIQKVVQQVDGEWETASLEQHRDQMHVTVRKYQNGAWSRRDVAALDVSNRVGRAPLEFECASLDIVPPRRQARQNQDWWIGVTETRLTCSGCGLTYADESPGFCQTCRRPGPDHRCSGCGRLENRSGRSWPGFCCGCAQYERIRPLWSTSV